MEDQKKSKNTNTFRFKSFAERVNEIDLRQLALYHIGHQYEELPVDNETYFHQTLKKWMVLNLSDEFSSFSRKCLKVVTLPQLLHQKDYVVGVLLDHLATATTLSLQPVLELLYVLARDLREDFYAYFQRVLDRLLCLLYTQDAEQLEWTLICLAFLFKTLKAHLKKNIGVVFHAILPLLDEQRYEPHVTNFAVECFSFIARDVKDYARFMDFMLESVVCEQVESVRGCGRLCFEIMRGVKGQFHSAAADFLQYLFTALLDENRQQPEQCQLLHDIVYQSVQELLNFIQPQQMSLFWNKLCAVAQTASNVRKLPQLLHIFLLASETREGKFVTDLQLVVPTIIKMCDLCLAAAIEAAEEALLLISNLVSKLLLGSAVMLTQLDTTRMLKKLLTLPQRNIYAEFVLSITAHAQFELLVLPDVLRHFEQNFDDAAFKLLATVVMRKRGLAQTANNLQTWQPYVLQLKTTATLHKLQDKLQQLNLALSLQAANESELSAQLLLLMLLPHFTALRQFPVEEVLQQQINEILPLLNDDDAKKLTIFALLVETYLHFNSKLPKALLLHCINALLPHLQQEIAALRCLDQLLLLQGKEAAKSLNNELKAHLSPLLSAAQHEIRQLSSNCLQALDVAQAPYKIFYEIENIEPTVHTYREQLLLLQKLETGGAFYKSYADLPQAATYQMDTVRFLLGLLYQNFKLTWTPVQQLLQEYARSLSRDGFWPIYKQQLQQTANAIHKQLNAEQLENVVPELYWNSDILNELLPLSQLTVITQLQLRNYRNLLWQRLPQFGQIVETENRDLVTLFLQFVNEEFKPLMESREYTCNLTSMNKSDLAIVEAIETDVNEDEGKEEEEKEDEGKEEDDEEDEEEEKELSEAVEYEQGEEDNNEIDAETVIKLQKTDDKEYEADLTKNRMKKFAKKGSDRHVYKKSALNVRSVLETLGIKLGIFAVQANPKALYRETELYQLYLELLVMPNAQLQKSALDCISAYKWNYLTPYKSALYAFVDEREFRKQLVQFKLEEVQPEHCEQFMQILLRLLYGKMLTKGAQMAAQQRKSLILRFLGQCSEAQLFWFLQMAFARYKRYTQSDLSLLAVVSLVEQDFKLEKAWLPQRLHSVVNLLELMRKQFGGLLQDEFQLYMLKLLVFVGKAAQLVLKATPNLSIAYKRVRSAALLSLVNFFAHIENFDWQEEQIQCLTEVFVWPNIDRLHIESIHTPTPLLKLLLQWGQQPRLFRYLNQKLPQAETQTIFYYIVQLLLNKRATIAVRRPIMSLIEQLLLTGSAQEGDVHGALPIVKPFIMQILERLRLNFGKKKTILQQRDLSILSMLTAHVEDAETCDTLLQLLLPVLISKTQTAAGPELITQIIITVGNLMKQLAAPEEYLMRLAPLFEHVQEVAARKMLCQLLTDLAKQRHKQLGATHQISMEMRETARIIFLLNAWSQRWLEQPDYDKRLDALKEMTTKLQDNTLNMSLGVLVIYNCFYFIRYDKDMGLRDNALEHLCLLMPKLCNLHAHEPKLQQYLIDEVLLNWVRRSLRAAQPHVLESSIKLLGEMSRECSEAHEVLGDLAALGNKQDAEVDFFENLVHLQSHRHGRALLKFCTHAGSLTVAPSVRTLMQILLPLASRYLLHDKHAATHTLVDAAIETVGVICQLLPWQQYHGVLRYYLMKMRSSQEHQKQCVRIVVRILDAFHFDLQHAETTEQQLKLLRNELTKEEEGQLLDQEIPVLDLELSLLNKEEQAAEALAQPAVAAQKPILQQDLVLSSNAAKRVMSIITTVLIPTLNRAITEKSSYDQKHKLNRKRFSMEREEEEILRVPIALALVKLMQKLPKQVLETSLPGVFIKVCTFLRSPLKSVRMLTRDILKKIMLTLGASYLPLLIDHLQTLLTRGFQVHVLAVTVHGVLDCLRDKLFADDVANCLSNLLEVALNDIFGEITAEKQVQKIAAHTPEAKPSSKSFLVLNIVARTVPESCLLDLLLPFKQHLAKTQSRKITMKIQQCFGQIVSGLVDNTNVNIESLLMFIYGTMSESISDLLPGATKHQLSAQDKERMRRVRPNCLLLQPTPRLRTCAVNRTVQTNNQANAHILIEFGLEMLHIVLKRKKLLKVQYQPFINPLLPLLRDALRSTHIRATTFALKCYALLWQDAFELNAEQEQIAQVVQRLFEILKNLSTFGASKQEDNHMLLSAAYKTVVALLRMRNDYELTETQLEQLLLQVEQHLFEGAQQALSFTLLKALVARRINHNALENIMTRVSQLVVVAQEQNVREDARSILEQYILEYALGKRLSSLLKFFSVQLCYELPAGRLSVLQFLDSMIRKFPMEMLHKHAEFLYISLGTRLVNDEEPECRKQVAAAIELLLKRLNNKDRTHLFELTLLFFNPMQLQNKITVSEMAAALCSRFVLVEKQAFAARLKLLLPILLEKLSFGQSNAVGRFVRAPQAMDDIIEADVKKVSKRRMYKRVKDLPSLEKKLLLAAEREQIVNKTRESMQRDKDHEIIQVQYCLLKILEYCKSALFDNADYREQLDELAYESQRLLAHEHQWVRCNAAQIIASILANYDHELVAHCLISKTTAEQEKLPLQFIYGNPAHEIKSLILDLCAQVTPAETPQTMIDEIVKIFLLVANMLRDVPFERNQKSEQLEAQEDENVPSAKINLYWLLRQIRFLVNKELVKAPHVIIVRTAFFNLIESLITVLNEETLEKLASPLLAMLVREMSEEDQQVDADLRQLALRVGKRLRKRLGSDLYDKLRNSCQMQLMVRRAERKRIIAQEKIHDPQRAAKRKVGMQERKKAAKKRKTDVMQGKVPDLKKKILKKRKRKAEEDVF